VSLRWCLQKDFIPSVIIGAKTVQQLEQNMAAGTGWKLTDEEVTILDKKVTKVCGTQNAGLSTPRSRSQIS